ncbi:MAG: hypothetical protein GXP56_12085 [Deltaproteobacteria bacterium]|nr:hypothetical protein [Deltaproteobacteria bacterium]
MAAVNDVVLIYLEDAPVSFARVESILPDARDNWYHIKLLMLQIPLQVVTWILKGDYINGSEFHMNGKKMKIKKVETPVEYLPSAKPAGRSDKKGQAKIISFSDLKKNHAPESG